MCVKNNAAAKLFCLSHKIQTLKQTFCGMLDAEDTYGCLGNVMLISGLVQVGNVGFSFVIDLCVN